MTFSYSAVWDDTVRLLRDNARLLAAIAGVFIFLPALLATHYLPPPETTDVNRVIEVTVQYYWEAWPWLLLQTLVGMVGSAAMLRLFLAPGTSVGGALGFGLKLLPSYFALGLITAFAIGFGLILLIVPGLYLVGRLVPAAAVMVAESRRNPFEAVSRSFAITRGHGWAVFGLVFIVAIVGVIVLGVVGILFGSVFLIAAGQDLGKLLAAIVSSACSTALATLMLTLYAAIYRALTGHSSAAAATFE